jgi:hypothetical protein
MEELSPLLSPNITLLPHAAVVKGNTKRQTSSARLVDRETGQRADPPSILVTHGG